MKPTHPAAQFLRRHRWRARGTLLVWALAATAAAGASLGALRLGWFARGAEWTLVATGIAALLLGAWFRRVRGLTSRALARELDTRWALRARLESAVELSTDASGWAEAQRDDATRQLASRKPPGGFAWFAGHAALALLLGLVAVEFAAWTWRALPAAAAVAKIAKAAATPADVRASIEWKSPRSEIKATAIEEVPLVALAESSQGFRSFTLKLTINGEREVTQLVEAAGDTVTAGAHELKASVFLDELNVKAGDMVAYRLVGELKGPAARSISSPLQFVEIRLPRKDAPMKGGGASEIVSRLFELKGRQLQLLKQNFTLQQLAEAGVDASWPAENTRVAAEQEALAGKAEELLPLARAAHAPAAIVRKLEEVPGLMHEAGKKIAAQENEAALKPQNRALAIITDVAKEIGQAMANGADATDPIRDEQTFKLPPRSETAAGELEKLAERQGQNNRQLAANAGAPAEGDHGAGDAQKAIAQDAEKLAAGGTLDPAVKTALDAAAAAAANAARQLAAGDTAAARVPAAEAQRAFEAAVAAQENAGRAGAVVELEQLRRSLNAASRTGDAAERAQLLRAARDQLRSAAVQQQRTGSADAAHDLARVAELIDAAKGAKGAVASATEKNSAERAREVAAAAAQAQVGLTPRNDAINRAVRRLHRVGPGETSPTAKGGAPLDELEMASQEAQWLTGDAATLELARQLAAQADGWLRERAKDVPPREASEGATKLAAALERGRATGQRDEIVRRFNPAEVEPAYRTAVENYFERLSRDTRPAPRPAAK